MSIRRKLMIWSLVVFCNVVVLAGATVGRSSANVLNQNCINDVSPIPTDINTVRDLMSKINNKRAGNLVPPVRWLDGAMGAAEYIAQTLSTEGYTPNANLATGTERQIPLGSMMIDQCPIGNFIIYNMPDVQTPNALAFELDNLNNQDAFIDYLNSAGASQAIFRDSNIVAEMGVGYAQTAEGKHIIVFVWMSREHISPNHAPPGNDPLYDGCGDADTLGSADESVANQVFTQNLFNYVNNARPDGTQFNQGGENTQEVVDTLDHVAQYLAQDMAHDYYNYNEDGIIDRSTDGSKMSVMIEQDGEDVRCNRNLLLEQYFPNQTIRARIFAFDDDTQYGAQYWFEQGRPYINMQTGPSLTEPLSEWLNASQYEYMSVGYAESESGSIRAVIVMIEEPIVRGTLPEADQVRPILAEPIACQPSNGSGGFTDSGIDIQPGDIRVLEQTFNNSDMGDFVVPFTIMVGENYNPDTPTLLTFYLHGDEGNHRQHIPTDVDGTYRDPASNLGLRQLINDNGWIYIAPQAPEETIPEGDNVNIDPPWHPWYGGANPYDLNRAEALRNGDVLAILFEKIQSQFNVCTNASLGATASGGSFFYDSHFLPRYGEDYPAYVALHCGSGGIRNINEPQNAQLSTQWVSEGYYSDIQSMAGDQALMDRIELSYVMGENDDRAILWPNIWYSIQTYDQLGYDVEREIVPDVKHCDDQNYDLTAMITEYWAGKSADIALPTPSTVTPTITPTVPIPLAVSTTQSIASSSFPLSTVLSVLIGVGMISGITVRAYVNTRN